MSQEINFERRLILQAGSVLGLSAFSGSLLAQSNWPTRPIKFIVPFVPGGTSDIVARSVATELSKQLPHPLVLENKAGGGGVPAMLEVSRAAGDGHTLILGHVGSLAVNPYIFNNAGYDVNKDFVPVTLLAKVPSLFVTHPDFPAKNLKELVEYAKRNPGKINYGSAGNASAGHLAIEYLKLTTGTEMTHIPYKGTGPALTDLLAGRLDFFSAGTPALLQHIKTGKLRAIATGTPQRIASLPNLPTVAESGYKGFESVQWYGILAPASTPPEIVKRLQEESRKALRSPAIMERFASEDAVIGGGTSAEFAAFISEQQKLWKEVVAKAKIKAD